MGSNNHALSSEKYGEFVRMQYSSHTLLVAVVVNTLFNLFIFPDFDFISANVKYPMFYGITISLRFVAVGMLWTIWANKTEGSILTFGPSKYFQHPWVLKLQSFSVVLMTIILSILVVTNSNFQPHSSGQLYIIICALRVYPVVTSFVLRDTNPIALGISWCLCILTLVVSGLQTQSYDRLADAVSYAFTTGIILYDTYRQNLSMFRLVTKLLETLKENEELAVEAQALELRAMIGNVAHDLKTPLTSFLGGIEFMRDVVASWQTSLNTPEFSTKAAENFAALRGCLRTMEGTNSFMTMTINRCLDYTKASKGVKLVPKYETVHLDSMLEFPVQLVQDQQSNSARIHLLPSVKAICSHIITDRQWLVENLLCLLSNAIKYSDKGTVEVSIVLHTCNTGTSEQNSVPFLRFEVLDTGIGLSEEAMTTLFNPFKQAQRLAGGTGLGLYSLAKRVEALQGQYGVSKRPDGAQGSLFWFTIPYRPDEMSAQAAHAPDTPTVSPTNSGNSESNFTFDGVSTVSLRVLVVDDAPMIVKMTSMMLKRKGHIVQHAVNGSEALEKIQQGCSSDGNGQRRPFDVVLMDLQMPVLDGIEALRRLRAAEAASRKTSYGAANDEEPDAQFVIALSANSDEGTRQEALEAGADAFIPKPFAYDSFLQVVHRHHLLG